METLDPASQAGAPAPATPAPTAPPPGAPTADAPAAAAPAPATAPPSGPRVVRTDDGASDGLTRCGRCGATEISLNVATGMLRCGFCRFEWQTDEALEVNASIGDLTGTVIGSGSADIVPSTDEVLTFKCTACGAEVVVDTASSTQSRCHWCRNKLSVNQQIPNGAVPDMVLPFKLPKDEAVRRIAEFVKKRTFFAHPRFKAEFNPENVMGVYLPYMVVDINARGTFRGQGEHQTRSYTVKQGDSTKRVYDADVYDVTREFGIHIDDLTVESSSERRNHDTSSNTNNIINSIMPFDVENSVRYDSNYLAGLASERRDVNVAELQPAVHVQAEDVARHKLNDTLAFYDRGVRWDQQHVQVVGQRWVSAYLPVWLYSYHQKKPNGRSLLHYVAVNARTGETMGSVPVNQRRLLVASAGVQVVGTILFALITLVGG